MFERMRPSFELIPPESRSHQTRNYEIYNPVGKSHVFLAQYPPHSVARSIYDGSFDGLALNYLEGRDRHTRVFTRPVSDVIAQTLPCNRHKLRVRDFLALPIDTPGINEANTDTISAMRLVRDYLRNLAISPHVYISYNLYGHSAYPISPISYESYIETILEDVLSRYSKTVNKEHNNTYQLIRKYYGLDTGVPQIPENMKWKNKDAPQTKKEQISELFEDISIFLSHDQYSAEMRHLLGLKPKK